MVPRIPLPSAPRGNFYFFLFPARKAAVRHQHAGALIKADTICMIFQLTAAIGKKKVKQRAKQQRGGES